MAVFYRARNRVNRGGYKYDAQGAVVSGMTIDDVLLAAFKSMMSRGLDIDPGWRQQALAVLHRDYPRAVERLNKVPKAASGVGFLAVRAFFKTFKQHLKSGAQFVDEFTAQERRDICLECPRRTSLTACGVCRSAVAAMAFPVPMKLPMGERRYCSACGCSLPHKIWLHPSVLAADPRPIEYPTHCWMVLESTGVSDPPTRS